MRRIKSAVTIALGVTVLFSALNVGNIKADDSGNEQDGVTAIQNDTADSGYIAWEKYGQTIYNTTTGLMSNKVSSITQTSDGIVWIGTDEGLAAYDGNEFTEYGSF